MTQHRPLHYFFIFVVATVALALANPALADTFIPQPPKVNATSYILVDAANGQVLVSHNADKELPPASLTKMMTAYIAEKEMQAGTVSGTDMVPISIKAWKTGGSRMFVREGTQVSLNDLMHGIIIDSGNDATVAVAEYLAGSVDAFADLMNQEAQRLGMTHTHYMNATGLPAKNHYSTARDLAILARAIIRDYPAHYALYKTKEFTYNNITQRNRNTLLFRNPAVDGIKTGHTEAAGYCLVTSANKDGMRLISVVMGTDSSQARARESEKLLTYGFHFFDSYTAYKAGQVLDTPTVWMGKQNQVRLGLQQDLVLTIPRNSHDHLKAELSIQPQLEAPLHDGQQYGTLTVSLDDEQVAQKPLVALEAIPQAGFFSRLWDHVVLFFKGLL